MLGLLAALQGIDVETNCIIVGDFNTTILPKEKRGGSFFRNTYREQMEDLISLLELYDSNPTKGSFTWPNRCTGLGHRSDILDRFLVNNSFFDIFFYPSSSIFPWCGLDHHPITLSLFDFEYLGTIPFHFNPL
jgi:hypothetical protein